MILVTGGAGFIGSHLVARLAARSERVVVLDDYSTGSRRNHVAGVEYLEGSTIDIRDLVKEKPRLIFHLGEFARVHASFTELESVFRSNGAGTAMVLRFWRETGAKLVYAGSSTRFAVGGGPSPYSVTKALNCELIARESHGWAITYFYNVYGPGERAGATGTLIETFRQQHLAGKPLTVVEPGTQLRHFTHVDDIVDGLVRVGDSGFGEFGIGNPKAYSVLEVARMFGGEIEMLPARPGDRDGSAFNIGKIRGLGWWARHRLPDYIADLKRAAAA